MAWQAEPEAALPGDGAPRGRPTQDTRPQGAEPTGGTVIIGFYCGSKTGNAVE